MKRIAVIFVALMLSAWALAEPAGLVGTWYLSEIRQDGASVCPGNYGEDLRLELDEDGVARMSDAWAIDVERGRFQPHIGKTHEGSWETDGDRVLLTMYDEAEPLIPEDGGLVLAIDDADWVFGREQSFPGDYVPAAPVTAEEKDFEGEWNAFKLGRDGSFYDFDAESGFTFGYRFRAIFYGGGLARLEAFDSFFNFTPAFADGACLWEAEDGGDLIRRMRFELLEDGSLSLVLAFNDGTSDLTAILSRAEG